MVARSLPRVLGAAAFALLLSAASAGSVAAAPAAVDTLGAAQLQTLLDEAGLSSGQAAQRLTEEAAAPSTASTLRTALGSAFAGAWFEPGSADLQVATTDPDTLDLIRTVGAVPRLVALDAVALDQIMAELNSRADTVPDAVTGWYVDPASNSVVVSATDPAAAEAFVAGQEGVLIEQVTQRPTLFGDLRGGDQIATEGGVRCSVGFNATSGGVPYIITAGHCTKASNGPWNGPDGTVIGPTVDTSFPGNDYGLIQVTSPSWQQTSQVASSRGEVTVTGMQQAPVGASVCRSGSSTGYRCGTVQALDQTVNYGGGQVVDGLTRTSACAEAGDSGGPFVSGTQAQGLLSGGTGSCLLSLLGAETFFQPIDEPLADYGLTLVTGGASRSAG